MSGTCAGCHKNDEFTTLVNLCPACIVLLRKEMGRSHHAPKKPKPEVKK